MKHETQSRKWVVQYWNHFMQYWEDLSPKDTKDEADGLFDRFSKNSPLAPLQLVEILETRTLLRTHTPVKST